MNEKKMKLIEKKILVEKKPIKKLKQLENAGIAWSPKVAMIIASTYGVDQLYYHSMLINSPK